MATTKILFCYVLWLSTSCTCAEHEQVPVKNGNWGEWDQYSTCSHSCGMGTKTRNRLCNNPPPSGGGYGCPGSRSETTYCHYSQCSVDGRWSNWNTWSSCSTSCGLGYMSRDRECNNPAPFGNGVPCHGNSTEIHECTVGPCSVEGRWSNWNTWSSCSTSCGLGYMSRDRTCNNPAPFGNGAPCPGNSTEIHECTIGPCSDRCIDTYDPVTPCPSSYCREYPVLAETHCRKTCGHCGTAAPVINGNWGDWSQYSTCSRTCGMGTRSRYRVCNNPPPSGGGYICFGSRSETTYCNNFQCSEWSHWFNGDCSVSCGNGTMERFRHCSTGRESDCTGIAYETVACTNVECL